MLINSRLHEQVMTSDLPGKSTGIAGTGRHVYQYQIGPKEQESIKSVVKLFE